MRMSSHSRRVCGWVKGLLPAILLGQIAMAQADGVDDYVKSEMVRLQIPAVAFAIVKNGRVVREEALGYADVALKRKAKVDDLYEIGSLTKQFTSMAVMMLVERKKIALEDPISKYLKDIPSSWGSIRVRNLLYQDSGIPEYVYLPGVGLLDNFTRPKFMETVGKLPLEFRAGDAWSYSNTNYALLGWIVEAAAKEPYTKFVEENILRPLAMTHTTFAERGVDIPGLARGYVSRRRVPTPGPRGAASIKSDGALVTDLDDMVKWDAALTNLRLVTRTSYQTIWTRAKLNSGRSHNYGMGWYLNQLGTKEYMGHSGSSAGYSAGISRYPGAKLTVVMLANLYPVGGEAMTKRIAVLFDPTLRTPPFASVTDPNPKRTERVKRAIQAIAADNPDETLLEPEFAIPMRNRRRTAAPGAWRQLRTVDSFTFGGAKQQGTDTFLTYRVSVGPKSFIVNILWSAGNKLAQATITPEASPKHNL